MNWTLLPPQIPWGSHGFLLKVANVELGLVDEVIREVPGPDLLRPRSSEDAHVGLGI